MEQFDDDVPILHQQPLRKPTDSEIRNLEAAGTKIKRGRFSPAENAQILHNYKEYVKDFGGEYAQIFGVGRRGRTARAAKHALTQFYSRLARGLPERHVWYVYLHARKICHPCYSTAGKRFTAKETKKLLKMRERRGDELQVIAETLNRTPDSLSNRLQYVAAPTKSGPFTGEDVLKLIMCICDVHGLTNFNSARCMTWQQIKWNRVVKLMEDRTRALCQDAWFHLVLPDCMSPTVAQLYFLCSLVRVYAKNGDDETVPWDQLAQDVGISHGHVAHRIFYMRKLQLIRQRYPDKDVSSVPLRKAAKLMMRVLKKKRIRVFEDFERRGGEKDLGEIPQFDSKHSWSWEFCCPGV